MDYPEFNMDVANRILSILTDTTENQGILLDNLGKKAEMRPQDLLKELEFMLLFGKLPLSARRQR